MRYDLDSRQSPGTRAESSVTEVSQLICAYPGDAIRQKIIIAIARRNAQSFALLRFLTAKQVVDVDSIRHCRVSVTLKWT